MNPESTPAETPDAAAADLARAPRGRGLSRGRFLAASLLLVGIYGYGLTRDVTEPWYGVHDWNGAFFSQLARNFLRYPGSVHHGMPIVAAGAEVPGPEDSSIYATHPPALVWLVAGAFKVLGESEWAARLVPILFSLATFSLLLWLISLAFGRRVALLAGLFYALMPMSVYFGRMVDHEAVCLFCMVAAAAGWTISASAAGPNDRGRRWAGLALAVLAIWLGIWVDWSVVIFGGLLVGWSAVQAVRGRRRWGDCLVLAVGGASAVASMVSFIVYAGLGARWGDLVDIFVSRAGEHQDIKGAGTTGDWWMHVTDNVTWLTAILALGGLVIVTVRRSRSLGKAKSREDSQPVAAEMREEALGDKHPVARDRSLGDEHPVAPDAARAGFALLGVTAVLWVVVFWKQFERHEYWMFYAGPAIAALAAIAILTIVDIAWRARAKASVAALGVVLAAALLIEVQFCKALFERVHQVHPLQIEDWKSIQAMTAPTDRVVLYDDPFRVERRGGYVFRNIVPPHLAWYLDRRIVVEKDLRRLAALSRDCAVFVIRSRDAEAIQGREGPLLEAWEVRALIGQVVVDLRSPREVERGPASEPVVN